MKGQVLGMSVQKLIALVVLILAGLWVWKRV